MYRTIGLAAIAAACVFAPAFAGNDGFIRPETRIRGCINTVDKVRDGTISPTEWLEQNKEEFEDLRLELKERNYPPAKAKDMMMGMAITLCMDRKVPGYTNICVSSRDNEKRDIQIMRTAHISECWAKQVGEVTPPPPPIVEEPREPWNRMPVVPPLTPPPMAPADLAQFNEDMATITLPPTSIYPYGNKVERFASCTSYWEATLNRNRPPQVWQVLYSVRVARCMYRTGFGFFQSGCVQEFPNMLNPRCYARFG